MRDKLKEIKNLDVISAFFFIAIVLTPVLYRFSLIDYDLHHESFLFKTAYDVANGNILFKETFTQYGALTVYIQALFIKVFGNTIAAVNLSACIALAVTYFFMYLIIKKFSNILVAAAGTVLIYTMDYVWYDTFHPWSSVYSLMLLVIGIYCWLKFIDTEKNYFIFLAGVATALCFWARQSVGIIMLLGLVIIVVLHYVLYKKIRLRDVGLLAATQIIVHMFFLIPILIQGALSDFYIQSIKGMMNFNAIKNVDSTFGDMLGNILNCLFPFNEGGFLFNLLPIILIVIFLALVIKLFLTRKVKQENTKDYIGLIVFIVWAIASWHQYYPVPDHRHIFWSSFPMIGCFLCAVYILTPFKNAYKEIIKSLAVILAICLFFGINFVNNISEGFSKYKETRTKYENQQFTFLNGLYLTDDQIKFQDTLFNTISNLQIMYPNKSIVNMTLMSEYACFEKRNFHPEFFNCVAIDYDFYGNVRDYVNENLPILICYEKDYDYYGYAGYTQYASISGNDSNTYWVSGSLGVYIPTQEASVGILEQMKWDDGTALKDAEAMLEGGRSLAYGTVYFLRDAMKYTLEIVLEKNEGDNCSLQIYSDWHTRLVLEKALDNGLNIIPLEGGWDNAAIYIGGGNGTVSIKKVNLICKINELKQSRVK